MTDENTIQILSAIARLEVEVRAGSGDLKELQADVRRLQDAVIRLQADAPNAHNDREATQKMVAALQARLDAIEADGRTDKLKALGLLLGSGTLGGGAAKLLESILNP